MTPDGRFGGDVALLRHVLASLRFRFDHVCADAPAGFAHFEAGAGVRTPEALVRHLAHLARRARQQLAGSVYQAPAPLSWPQELARVRRELAALDRAVAAGEAPVAGSDAPAVVRGPVLDMATHVGQLATLRRLAGSPAAPVAYPRADMPFAAEVAADDDAA